MNKKKQSEVKISEYIVTIIVTIIVLFSLCLGLQLQLYFNIEAIIAKKQFAMKNLAKFYNIEQLEKMHNASPNNYLVAINLAKAYESVEQNGLANALYREALANSNNSNYAIYSYAIFCAKMGWYGLCADLAEELYSKSKTIYKYKVEIYEELAKAFDKNEEYEASVKSYQIAHKYAMSVKNKKILRRIKEEYSREYVKLADHNISLNKVDDAVLNLKNSLNIKELDIAKYKLALIYKDTDKYTAEKYFHEVLKNNPYLVNPYIYNKLLQDLIIDSKNNRSHSAEFYNTRLKYLISKIQNCYIYQGDVIFKKSHIVEYKKPFKKEKRYELYFTIKNNTKIDISSLYVKVDIYIKDNIYTATKKIIDSSAKFEANDELNDVKIDLPNDFTFMYENKNSINTIATLKYYVKKQKNAPWTLAKIESVKF